MTPSVFLDRDGVINEEIGYLTRPDQLRVLPGVTAGLRRLNLLSIPAIVVTNQSAVARGYCTEIQLSLVHQRLSEMLAADDAKIDRFYHCPHHPSAGLSSYRGSCTCRKPGPGMLKTAARELSLDLTNSFMIGDKLSDLEAGWRAGCRTLLVLTGYGRETLSGLEISHRKPDHIAPHLDSAVDWILERLGCNRHGHRPLTRAGRFQAVQAA